MAKKVLKGGGGGKARGDIWHQGLGFYLSQPLIPMAWFEEQDHPPLSLAGHRRLGVCPLQRFVEPHHAHGVAAGLGFRVYDLGFRV